MEDNKRAQGSTPKPSIADDSLLLRIADLESIKSIVETKVKELRLVDRSKGGLQQVMTP
jgi:hypothetical protein